MQILKWFRRRLMSGPLSLRLYARGLADSDCRLAALSYLEGHGLPPSILRFITMYLDCPGDFTRSMDTYTAGDLKGAIIGTLLRCGGSSLYYRVRSDATLSLAGPGIKVEIARRCLTFYSTDKVLSDYATYDYSSYAVSLSLSLSQRESFACEVMEALDMAASRMEGTLGTTHRALLSLIRLHPEEAPRYADDPIIGSYCRDILSNNSVVPKCP